LCEVASFLVVENIDDNEAVTKICAEQHPVSWGETFASPVSWLSELPNQIQTRQFYPNHQRFSLQDDEKNLWGCRQVKFIGTKHLLKYTPRTR
jgi:hypothetical protein